MELEPGIGPLGAKLGQRHPSKSWTLLHRVGDIWLCILSLSLLATCPKLYGVTFAVCLVWLRLALGGKLGVAALLLSLPAFSFLVLAPKFIRCTNYGPLTSCKANLKNIATALEMYSTDNAGCYPDSLESLTPQYLKALPSCPCVQRVTYSQGYRCHAKPDRFSVYCYGFNHEGHGIHLPNYPRYYNEQGLVER
jgi:hypothetical protein